MKRFLRLLKPYTIRPMVYSCFSKTVLGLCAILLWDRLIPSQTSAPPHGTEDAVFVLALWFLAWAWFHHLALDGIKTKLLTGFDHLTSRQRKHSSSYMVDFVDEKIMTLDDLEEEEQIAVNLCSNLLVGLLFLCLLSLLQS